MYRDLKPDNIGFDVRGDVKIFGKFTELLYLSLVLYLIICLSACYSRIRFWISKRVSHYFEKDGKRHFPNVREDWFPSIHGECSAY